MLNFWTSNCWSSVSSVTMATVSLTMTTIIRLKSGSCTSMIRPRSTMKFLWSSQVRTCAVTCSNVISNITPSPSFVVATTKKLSSLHHLIENITGDKTSLSFLLRLPPAISLQLPIIIKRQTRTLTKAVITSRLCWCSRVFLSLAM